MLGHVHELTTSNLTAHLASKAYGRANVILAETASTNDDARQAAAEGAVRGFTVVADAQTRGRGAHGRVWSSPRGTDLYLSIVERPDAWPGTVDPARVAPLTLAVGLGVADAIHALVPTLDPKVKWPNDVWIGRKKCAGILCEASSIGARMEAIILGIGLGVNRTEYEPELATTATSLLLEQRRTSPDRPPLDRSLALALVLEHVERWVDRFAAEGPAPIVAALEPRLALRGERVRVDEIEGELLGIAPSGALRVYTSAGVRDLVAGTLRPA